MLMKTVLSGGIAVVLLVSFGSPLKETDFGLLSPVGVSATSARILNVLPLTMRASFVAGRRTHISQFRDGGVLQTPIAGPVFVSGSEPHAKKTAQTKGRMRRMASNTAPTGLNVNIALEDVRARIADACARAGRAVDQVRLVAVSKKQPLERVRAAFEAGQRLFGENYVQEMEARMREIPGAEWHMIGHVQTNKAKKAIAGAMIHGVDSEKLARALSKAAMEAGRSVEVLIEVNVGGEATKSGIAADAVEPLARALGSLPGLSLRGLMCIPPPSDTRRHFSSLRELRDDLAKRTGIALPELSMGM